MNDVVHSPGYGGPAPPLVRAWSRSSVRALVHALVRSSDRPTLRLRLALVVVWGTVFVALHVAELAQLAPTTVRSYLDDVLCLPLVLTLLRVVQNLTVSGGRASPRRGVVGLLAGGSAWWQGALAVVYFSVVFELVLPRLADGFTGDVKDVLAYIVGWLVFEAGWRVTARR